MCWKRTNVLQNLQTTLADLLVLRNNLSEYQQLQQQAKADLSELALIHLDSIQRGTELAVATREAFEQVNATEIAQVASSRKRHEDLANRRNRNFVVSYIKSSILVKS